VIDTYARHLVRLSALLIAIVVPSVFQTPSTFERGASLFDEGRYAEAERELTAVASASPSNSAALYYLGRIALERDDVDHAVRWLERAVRLDDRRSDYHYWLGRALGRQAASRNFIRKAILARKMRSAFERAVQLDPEHVDARTELGRYYLLAPRLLGGGVTKARAQGAAIAKHNAQRGRVLIGWILHNEGEARAAEREFEAAIAQYPDSAPAYFGLAHVYQDLEHYDRAFLLLERYATLQPDDMNAYYQLGKLGAVSGTHLDAAEQALKRYLTHKPHSHEASLAAAHGRLGMVYEKRGDRELARREYQNAVKLEPETEDFQEALKRVW
jgi:tetratricopeptide (TPR) repeat protein